MSMHFDADYSELLNQLHDAERAGSKAVAFGLYDTAGVMVEAIKNSALSLPFKSSTTAQIAAAAGISDFRGSGDGYQTSVGFEGYFAESGFPIPYFVREVENGTSKIPANPFVQRAFAQSIDAAEAAGVKTAEGIINDILK